jgi:endoglucanase
MIPPHGASPIAAAVQALAIPNNDPNTIVSLHTYYPSGFSIGASPNTWGTTTADYVAASTSLSQIVYWLPNQAVVIGEWGSIGTDVLDSRVAHAQAYAQDATARGMCPIWWDDGNTSSGFGLLNRKTMPLVWTWPTIANALKTGATLGSTTGVDATGP